MALVDAAESLAARRVGGGGDLFARCRCDDIDIVPLVNVLLAADKDESPSAVRVASQALVRVTAASGGLHHSSAVTLLKSLKNSV